jgi:zinc protease
MRRIALAALILIAAAAQALPPNVEKVETYAGVTQYRLKSNDMTILLVPNHASPVFTFMVVYHVGSRNEAPGNTGSAHLLEHMIFNKSTENFGKAKGHKTFQEVLYEAGADYASTNMTTGNDRMNGYSTLPADKLELAMKIEADRLGRALILDSERQPEMSVVRNEYEIGENNPSNALYKAVVGAAIQAHPYHWDTIGYRSDIEGVSTEQLREHYKNFFYPNNSDAILVGDFDPDKALEVFDREFGGFAKSSAPIPQVITVEPPQEGERRALVKRPGNVSIVEIGFIRPGALHPDFIPLDVLSNILGEGVNARLYQALVEKGLASDIQANNFTLKDPFPILFEATVAPGKTPQEVEDALKAALFAVAKNGVTDAEVKRAQQQIEVAIIRQRDGTYNLAANLGEAVASANWKWFFDYLGAMKAVTAADVNRVAATYLVPDHATVGWFVPGPPRAPLPAARGEGARRAGEGPTALATPPPSARTASFAARTTRRVLPNGVIVDVVENHAVPTVAIRGLVFAGDASTASKPALAQLNAKMLPRGTASRTKEQIAALLDGVGATRSYFATVFETQLSFNGMARDLPLLVDVLGDELQRPAFSAEELAKAKSELKTDVLRNAENTSNRAFERLTQLVYPASHPYRAAGKDALLASLDAAGADDLRAFHKARFTGANTIISIVGDVDAAQAVALVQKALGSMPKGTRLRLDAPRTALTETAAREAVTMKGKANMNLMLGSASGLRRSDPDYEAALIANAALGQNALSSRLGKRIRDTEGLSYNLASRYQLTDALDGVFAINVNVAPQNMAKALKSTREVVATFAKEGITPEEVEVQKNFFAGNYQVALGTNAGVASALVTAEKFAYGPSYLDDFPTRMRRVTKEQVDAAIRAHLAPSKLHLVVAGDLETLPVE